MGAHSPPSIVCLTLPALADASLRATTSAGRVTRYGSSLTPPQRVRDLPHRVLQVGDSLPLLAPREVWPDRPHILRAAREGRYEVDRLVGVHVVVAHVVVGPEVVPQLAEVPALRLGERQKFFSSSDVKIFT